MCKNRMFSQIYKISPRSNFCFCHSPFLSFPFSVIPRMTGNPQNALFHTTGFPLRGGNDRGVAGMAKGCHSPLDGEIHEGIFCSFFSSVRRTNQEEPPPGIGLFRSDADASLGAAELAALTQSSPSFRPRLPPSRPDKGVFSFPLSLGLLPRLEEALDSGRSPGMTTYAFPRHASAIPHLMGNP